MSKAPVTPENILAADANFAQLGDVVVRKGSIAAFLKNIDLLEDSKALEEEKAGALDMIKQLASAVVAAGLHRHANFKNKKVQEVLDKEAALQVK